MKWTIRNVIAYFTAKAIILSGKVNKAKSDALNGKFILSVYFHNPTKKEFLFAAKWLKNNGFKVLHMHEFVTLVEQNSQIPNGAALLTVDDGWASNVPNMVTVAEKEQVPITIFIATEAIEEGNYWFNYAKKAFKLGLNFPSSEQMKKLPNEERLGILQQIKVQVKLGREAMTINDVAQLSSSAFVTIGAHSHSHPILINCNNQEMETEIRVSKAKLEEWTNKSIETFAYPNGDFGKREEVALHAAGYKIGFANNPVRLDESSLQAPFSIPRTGFLEGASEAENICRLVGVWHSFRIKLFKKK
jgi:peptidoglycan/xylan/chitin deacetylase (PgdA/CDA1 family)